MNLIAASAVLWTVAVPTAVNAFATSPAQPEFYSALTSPLAKTAATFCAEGRALPATIAMTEAGGTDYDSDSDATGTVATFAGGCFWGLELAYRREPGVLATCVGYTQGHVEYPRYGEVCSEETGHTEAVLLAFDPTLTTYARLAAIFFDRIPDPTTLNRVGRDRGTQYRTGMYAHSEEQLAQAQTAFQREDAMWRTSGRPVVTEVERARVFWPAEEEHQRYLEKGGSYGRPQSADKGSSEEIRCYG